MSSKEKINFKIIKTLKKRLNLKQNEPSRKNKIDIDSSFCYRRKHKEFLKKN